MLAPLYTRARTKRSSVVRPSVGLLARPWVGRLSRSVMGTTASQITRLMIWVMNSCLFTFTVPCDLFLLFRSSLVCILRTYCVCKNNKSITNLLVSGALFRNMDLALCLNVFGCLACFQGWHKAREQRRRARHGVTYPKVLFHSISRLTIVMY